jgi:hypothetical protein
MILLILLLLTNVAENGTAWQNGAFSAGGRQSLCYASALRMYMYFNLDAADNKHHLGLLSSWRSVLFNTPFVP